ncbi:MAG: DUF4911 domain-containing protein [Thermodesulfobacteriota bacterium]
MDPQRVYWLKFILESYEGLALASTAERNSGRVDLLIAPGGEEETIGLLRSLKDELGLVEGLSDDLDDLLARNSGSRMERDGHDHAGN